MKVFEDALQGGLEYRFKNLSLLETALTHRSFGDHHNERMEFLGDAVLDLLVAECLYQKYPYSNEGELSHMRARLVCSERLAEIGRQLRVGEYLNLGAGELKSGGRQRESNIANAVEALVAAVYLDGGIEECRRVVSCWFAHALDQLSAGVLKDAKTRLQEYLQSRQLQLPVYSLVERLGDDHNALFTMQCNVTDLQRSAVATASSRKKAEQLAADAVLKLLEL